MKNLLASTKYELYNALGRLLCPRKQLENNVYSTAKAKARYESNYIC